MCDSSSFKSVSRERGLEPSRELAPAPQPTVFHPLTCFYVRDFNYHPESADDIAFAEGLRPSPIRISTDLLFTGGFVDGLKLDSKSGLDLRFIDEYGRVFRCQYCWHLPRRVAVFLWRGFVRLRFFSQGFYWEPLDTPPVKNEARAAYAVLSVIDDQGREHNFNFWVEKEIRDLFPTILSEVP